MGARADSFPCVVVRYPMTEVRGLCLASTPVLHTLAGVQLWLHRPTHQGLLTIVPSLLSMPNKEHSTENILPAADSLPELTACSVVKVPAGEPSLFSEEKCLSLHGTLLSEKRKSGNGKHWYGTRLPVHAPEQPQSELSHAMPLFAEGKQGSTQTVRAAFL